MTDTPTLSARALYDRLRRGDPVSVLDVRDRDEFDTWHVDGPTVTARQVPFVQFVAARVAGDPTDLLPADLDEPVVAVCGVGEASDETAAMLREAGVDAENLAGGMAAWSDLLVDHDLAAAPHGAPRPGDVAVIQFERPSTGCLSYLVESDGAAVLVDPLHAFADDYVAAVEARAASVVAVVDTHVHADHLSGARALAARTGADLVLPAGATDRGLAFDARLVADTDTVAFGDAELDVLATPGHTSEHVALACDGVVFTGDTLFLDGVGRPDLEDESRARDHAADLYDTLHTTLFTLDDDTLVAPGHVQPGAVATPGPYVATLSDVRDRVSLTALDEPAFVDRVAGDLPPRPANHARIIEYNLGHATIDQSALSLELGPNNCAIPG